MAPISGEGFPGDGQSGPHPLLVRAAKDVAPHWSVTFWVHNADAVAARAAELGGGGCVPYDFAPGARAAVVADPQGATLTVGQPPPAPERAG